MDKLRASDKQNQTHSRYTMGKRQVKDKR